jgi:hypothetical protein
VDGRAKFDDFFRKLTMGKVDVSADRTDVDLGPGLTITLPDKFLAKPLPEAYVYDQAGGLL